MRSIIKHVTAAAIHLSTVITHQQPLDARLLEHNVQYDAAITEVYERTFHTTGPLPEALLAQIRAVKVQNTDMSGEAGCNEGNFALVCVSLGLKELSLEAIIWLAEWIAAEAGSEAAK